MHDPKAQSLNLTSGPRFYINQYASGGCTMIICQKAHTWTVDFIFQNRGSLEGNNHHDKSIASTKRLETARYRERAPSDGMNSCSAPSITEFSAVFDRSLMMSLDMACRASEASAFISSGVNGTNGSIVVTRDRTEAYVKQTLQRSARKKQLRVCSPRDGQKHEVSNET